MSTTLLVLVPLLVAPVVLLLAFAGCTPFEAAETPPETPPEPVTPPVPPPPPPTAPPYREVVAKTPGLLAFWQLDEPAGTLTLDDSGPFGPSNTLDGTYRAGVTRGRPGALSANDAPNLAAEFDGDGGYAEVPFNANLNPQGALKFTVELWVKPGAAVDGDQTLVSSREFRGGGFYGYEVVMTKAAGAPPAFFGRVWARGISPRAEVEIAPQGPATEWRHVVFAYDNGTLDLTVTARGGTPIVAPSVTEPVYDNVTVDGALRLGAGHQRTAPPVNFLAGTLDAVAFYNTKLTPQQITARGNAAQGKPTP